MKQIKDEHKSASADLWRLIKNLHWPIFEEEEDHVNRTVTQQQIWKTPKRRVEGSNAKCKRQRKRSKGCIVDPPCLTSLSCCPYLAENSVKCNQFGGRETFVNICERYGDFLGRFRFRWKDYDSEPEWYFLGKSGFREKNDLEPELCGLLPIGQIKSLNIEQKEKHWRIWFGA